MRISSMMGQTRREEPNTSVPEASRLLEKAGYFRELDAGNYAALHLGFLLLQRIREILSLALQPLGATQLALPAKTEHPADPAAMIARLCQSEIRSYRQLALSLKSEGENFRAGGRIPAAGLPGIDPYPYSAWFALEASEEGLRNRMEEIRKLLLKAFQELGLSPAEIAAHPGWNGRPGALAWYYPASSGPDRILRCPACGYAAEESAAETSAVSPANNPQQPLEEVHTPGAKTIADLAAMLDLPPSAFGKMVFFSAENLEGKRILVMAMSPGNRDVSPQKVQMELSLRKMDVATDAEIKAAGCEPGFASPVNITHKDALLIVDPAIAASHDLLVGANKVDYHLRHAAYGRDFKAQLVADICTVTAGLPCPTCKSALTEEKGIILASLRTLQEDFMQAGGALFNDENGRPSLIHMAVLQTDLARLAHCVTDVFRDEKGLSWPIALAPYQVHLVSLADSEETVAEAEALYTRLEKEGIRVLYDDRPKKMASPGERFNDSDLRGLPLRLTVSRRARQEGGLEWKERMQPDKEILPVEEVIARLINGNFANSKG